VYVVFSKTVSTSTIRRILHAYGHSYHKPEVRNTQRDEELISRWTNLLAPELISSDIKDGFKPMFMDECAVRSNEVRRSTWGLMGVRLIVPQGKRLNINCIGAIGIDGGSSFLTTKGRIDEDFVIAFLKQLLEQYPNEKFAIYRDNASYHVSKKVIEFISSNERLVVRSIPKYAPELNLIELVWAQLKNHGLRMLAHTDTDNFEQHVGNELREIATAFHQNKSMLNSKELSYIMKGMELAA
jgi:transposase